MIKIPGEGRGQKKVFSPLRRRLFRFPPENLLLIDDKLALMGE